jgi:glutamate carboxypeptidase
MGEMIDRVVAWARINSSSDNPDGLERMMEAATEPFAELADRVEEVELPGEVNGRLFRKGEGGILLVGHIDTVYPYDSPFQEVEWLDEKRLRGPGVADMKGGLVVMLEALRRCKGRSWTVYLSPDEETGSLGSRAVLEALAPQFEMGLVFEPALADGAMASARKGSANFTVTTRGMAAHAGRHFFEGKSAIVPLAEFVIEVAGLSRGETTVNVGKIVGGTAINTVPDRAACTVNVRAADNASMEEACAAVKDAAKRVAAQIEGGVTRPPKPEDEKMRVLMARVNAIDPSIEWRETGGVCDGNLLAAAGLPTLDCMGVRGGKIHSEGEFLEVKSLEERAKLAAKVIGC